MSPELITAIKQRIAAGKEKEAIKNEVLAMGHVEEVFEAAFTLAVHDLETPTSTAGATSEPALPSAYQLLAQALAFVSRRWDLILCVLLPGLLFFALSYLRELITEPRGLSVLADVAALAGFVGYLVAMFLVMYVASHEDTPTYSEGLTWVRQHIFSLLWVSILFTGVILGGFLFLIIPGIVLTVSLYFSQYALILEDQKGMAALCRSRALVQGRFFAIAWKVFAFSMYILVPILLVVAVGVLMWAEVSALSELMLVGDIATEILSALFAVVSARAMGQLYRALQVGRPLTAVTKVRQGIYWSLFGVGVLAVGAMFALVIFFQSFIPNAVTGEVSTLQSDIQSTSLYAQLYSLEHDNSFAGVCDTLRQKITAADVVECNDSADRWAIQAQTYEEQWCADTTTLGKQVETSLGDRLSCLILPDNQPLQTPAEATSSASEGIDTPFEAESSIE